MAEEKRKRRRRQPQEKPKLFPIGCTVWSIVYAVAFLIIVILPTFVTTGRLLNNLTLFYHYIFLFFVFFHAVLAWISRKSRLVLAALTALLLFSYASPACRDLMLNHSTTAGQGRSLTVVTYNWLASNSEFETFHGWVLAQKPDIIAIEEKPTVLVQHYDEIQSLYPYRTNLENGDDVVLLSRFPIASQRTFRVGNRPVVEARVRAPSGILNVYALHSQTVTSQSLWDLKNDYLVTADAIIEPDGPTLVMGDFNATRWDPLYRQLVGKNDLHTQPQFFPPVTRVLGQEGRTKFGSPIDHVLVGSNMKLRGCRTAPAMGSDHVPVICDLDY